MKAYRYIALLVMVLMVTACNSLPGLRVLSGQDTAESQANNTAQNVDLVMADKTGNVDASLLAAADRLEAAAGNVDVVEVREDLQNDAFDVFEIMRLDGDPTSSQQQDIIDYYNSLRRAVELTWQATLTESERSGILRIEVIAPQIVSTLDNGPSFLGFVQLILEIDRSDAVNYLSRPHTLDDFFSLIVDGKMRFQNPQGTIYNGRPNHPLFMLPGQSG